MEILICIKQVPDDAAEVRLEADGTLDLDGVTQVVNASDTYVLEMTTRLKEAVGGEITVTGVGGESVHDALKTCLAVGARHAFLLTDPTFEGSDSLGKARILAAVKAKLEEKSGKPFDLIFCGFETTDKATGQTGAQLVELLNLPLITSLMDIFCENSTATAKQGADSGYDLTDSTAPHIVTIDTPAYVPRYPTIKSKLVAKETSADPASLSDLDEDTGKVGRQAALVHTVEFAGPPQKAAGIEVKEETCKGFAHQVVAVMVEAKAL